MPRRCRWLVVLVVAALGCAARSAPEPVYVGHLAPLSGTNRIAGEHARQGVHLAVTEAKAGQLEMAGRPIAVVHVDTRGELERVQEETVRLLTINKVAALLGGPGAVAGERVLRADQPYGVPVVVPGESTDAGTDADALFLGAVPGSRGRALARYASHDLKAARAAILTDSRDPVAIAVAAAFMKEWPARGAEEWTYASAADGPALASRAAKARPDVVLVSGNTADFRTIRTGLTEAGFQGAMVYGGEDAGPMGGGIEAGPDVYLATVYCPEKLTAGGQEFARRYEVEFREPPDLCAAQAYDGTRLLIEVLHRAENLLPATLREELARTESFNSVMGPIRWKDHRPRRAVFLMQVKQGRASVIQTVEPDAG